MCVFSLLFCSGTMEALTAGASHISTNTPVDNKEENEKGVRDKRTDRRSETCPGLSVFHFGFVEIISCIYNHEKR